MRKRLVGRFLGFCLCVVMLFSHTFVSFASNEFYIAETYCVTEEGGVISSVAIHTASGFEADLSNVSYDVTIIGGYLVQLGLDFVIVVPNDDNGNQPLRLDLTVEDTDEDGLIDKITVSPTYPLDEGEYEKIYGWLYGRNLIDEEGNIIEEYTVVDENFEEATSAPIISTPEIVGGYLDEDGNIVVANDETGNTPYPLTILAQDTDGDGIYDKLTFNPTLSDEDDTEDDTPEETTITVEYYLENLEDEEFTLDALTSVDCTIGDLFSALSLEKEYEGFTLNAELTTADEQEVTDETTITNNMIVKLYYERNIYTVTYEGNGNDRGPTEVVEELAYKYGAKIVVKSPEELGMAYTDHTFLYWEGSILNPGDTWIVTSDKTLVAQWAEEETTTEASEAEVPETESEVAEDTEKTVKTGDTANTMVVYLLFGTAFIAILAGYRRAKEREF